MMGMKRQLSLVPIATAVLFCARLANANPTVATPNGLCVIASGRGKLCLYWNKVPGANGYLIYRSLKPGGQNFGRPTIRAVPAPDSFAGSSMKWWVDRGLVNGREYFYRVKAVGAKGQLSAASEENSDAVDPTGIPWDTRDARKIIAHSIRAAKESASDLRISPRESFTILGPDGVIYERGHDGRYTKQPAKNSGGIAFPTA